MKEGILLVAQYKAAVLIAESPEEQATGLMFREPPLPYMAFPYKQAQTNSFWMKSTKAPLDILFCQNNKIIDICKGEPFSTSIIGNIISDLVVEFPYGTCKTYGINIGDNIALVQYDKKTH